MNNNYLTNFIMSYIKGKPVGSDPQCIYYSEDKNTFVIVKPTSLSSCNLYAVLESSPGAQTGLNFTPDGLIKFLLSYDYELIGYL